MAVMLMVVGDSVGGDDGGGGGGGDGVVLVVVMSGVGVLLVLVEGSVTVTMGVMVVTETHGIGGNAAVPGCGRGGDNGNMVVMEAMVWVMMVVRMMVVVSGRDGGCD